jgi:hypothetical protein
MASFGHFVRKLSANTYQIEWFQDYKNPYGVDRSTRAIDRKKKATEKNAKAFAKKHNLEWNFT